MLHLKMASYFLTKYLQIQVLQSAFPEWNFTPKYYVKSGLCFPWLICATHSQPQDVFKGMHPCWIGCVQKWFPDVNKAKLHKGIEAKIRSICSDCPDMMRTIEKNVDFNNVWPDYVHDMLHGGRKREIICI